MCDILAADIACSHVSACDCLFVEVGVGVRGRCGQSDAVGNAG